MCQLCCGATGYSGPCINQNRDANAEGSGSTPPMAGNGVTIQNDFTAILWERSWNGAVDNQSPTVITYSFETEPQQYLAEGGFNAAFEASFQAFNASQIQTTEQALELWEQTSGITFVEVAAGEGDIRFGNYDFNQSDSAGFSGFAYYPGKSVFDWNSFEFELGGDVFIDLSRMNNMSLGLMAHEIGHAIGLKHPFEGDIQLSGAFDNGNYTVMSYTRGTTTGLGTFDGQAAQYLYGPTNFVPSTTGGVTSYTIDVQAFSTTQIWGSANSEIIGTSFDDTISAGAGADLVGGFKGDDILDGQGGADSLIGGSGDDILVAGAGNDRLIGGVSWDDPESGFDTVSYQGVSSSVRVNLLNGFWEGGTFGNGSSAQTGVDAFYGINGIIGGSGNDDLTGDNT